MNFGIRSSVLTDYAQVAKACGLNPQRMLLDSKLPASSLSERDLMLPVDRVDLLLEKSAEQSGNRCFGLDLAEHRRLSHLGELGLLLRDLPTARDIHEALSHFSRWHNEALVYALELQGDTANILMDSRTHHGVLSRQFTEFVLGAAYRILETQFADDYRSLRVCFRHAAPAETSRHRRFFGHLPQFGHGFNGFVGPTGLLDKCNPAADPAFLRYTQNLMSARLSSSKATRSEDVRRLILQLLPRGQCDAERIATCLGIDRRTVARQLEREGTTVSTLIHQVRKELFERYADDSALPLSKVAQLLGFHSASALSNWHRRQFGVTPTRHRHKEHAVNSSY
jgi:AraC-like DNA-binding protein